MHLSEAAAAWASRMAFDEMPADVVASTKLRILDIAGAMLAGSQTPDARATYASATDTSPGNDGIALGFERALSVSGAALVNGTSALVLEFDDSHLESAIHVGSPVVSAAVPMACRLGLSGRELVEAVAVGNELTCQLGLIAPGRLTPLGFHPTGIFGTFGAIYALGKCLGFSPEQFVNAVGLGGSMSAASMASWEDGTAAKSLHAGFSAYAAVNAVSLARHGITGPAVLFEGRWGFFRAHVQDEQATFRFDGFAERLGNPWEAGNIAPKAYPCGHYIQPHIEAALEIVRAHRLCADDVAEVTCWIPSFVVAMVASPLEEKRRPNTLFQARMSLQHAMAEAIVAGRMDKGSFAPANLRNPAFNAVADKVRFEVDVEATDRSRLGGTVLFRLSDGRTLTCTISDMRGMPQNPMATDDLVAKFCLNADGVIPSNVADDAIGQLLDLEHIADVSDVFAPLCRGLE